jgi:polysaccharide pyruvyl transferase WcaK-like protein
MLAGNGGDSFTEIYGPRRLKTVALPQLVALDVGTPLVLLPQTYGPFRSARGRRLAQYILRRATMAWARDHTSYHALKSLLNEAFDPAIHKEGVDLAFGLEPHLPRQGLAPPINEWLQDGGPIVGVNISGMLFHQPEHAKAQYGLQAHYPALVLELIRRLLRETDARVVLVPHVNAPPDSPDSDGAACRSVYQRLRAVSAGRLAVAPTFACPTEAKWLISRCNWFCGARMHACIAALSSSVPAAGMAYSDKARGVFGTCDLASQVVDLRSDMLATVVDRLLASWHQRVQLQQRLERSLPMVRRQIDQQMDDLVSLGSTADDRSSKTTVLNTSASTGAQSLRT